MCLRRSPIVIGAGCSGAAGPRQSALGRNPLRPGGKAASLRSTCRRRSPIVIGAGCSGAVGPRQSACGATLSGRGAALPRFARRASGGRSRAAGPRDGFRAAFYSLVGHWACPTKTRRMKCPHPSLNWQERIKKYPPQRPISELPKQGHRCPKKQTPLLSGPFGSCQRGICRLVSYTFLGVAPRGFRSAEVFSLLCTPNVLRRRSFPSLRPRSL
jgi:hypothetical protein